jgi:small-conductance mechanosensitive channel
MFFAISGKWTNWLISIIITLGCIGLAFASRYILKLVGHHLARHTKTILDDLIIEALKMPVFLMVIAAGIWIGISRINELAAYLPTIHKIFIALYCVIVAVGLSRVANAIITWYGAEIATRTKSDIDNKLMPLVRRTVTALIFILALLFVLQTFIGLDKLTPLLAGLGIGGVAVALALQPTLSNFLAGTYVMSDALIHKGDYIALDGGQEGFVQDIGWRTTKIRHWQGNLIIMPNSKLSDAVVTNYERPDKTMQFTVNCGVSYNCDLDKVEKVTMEVAKQILRDYPEGVNGFMPVVRFNEFGDSNINFDVILQATDRSGHFIVKHAFIKALHRRFQEEGIEIQYPVRKLMFTDRLLINDEDTKKGDI